MSKKMLWLGSYMSEVMYSELSKMGYNNASSFVSQRNLLNGIEKAAGIEFDSINACVMSGFPIQGPIKIKEIPFSHADNAKDLLVGYFNPIYANRMFMRSSMIRAAAQWLDSNCLDEDELEIFIYEMRTACLDAAKYIKKRKKKFVRIHLIIPDLPMFMDLNMNCFKRILKKIDEKHIMNSLAFVDDFLPYAESMVDYLRIREKKWMVMEGSIGIEDIDTIVNDSYLTEDNSEKILMYAGRIDYQYGVEQLVDAMEFLPENYKLWITGGGIDEEKLREKITNKNRIKYFGHLETRKEVVSLLVQATILVNTRNPNIDATKYCFPSKLFEYMLLGKPVLSVKLEGIPKEYSEYIYFFDELDAKQIACQVEKIEREKNSDQRHIRGVEFVKQNKNNLTVGKKIIKFINFESNIS